MYINKLNDSIIDFLRNNPNGVSSLTIAELFLKIKHPDKRMTHIAVRAILNNDKRCTFRESGNWYYVETCAITPQQKICEAPWVSIYLLSDTSQINNQLLYVSVFSVFDIPQCLFSQWFSLPDSVSRNKRQVLTGKFDSYSQNKSKSLSQLSELLKSKNILFLSFNQQTILMNEFLVLGEILSDTTLLASQLITISEIKTQDLLEIPLLAKMILGKQHVDHKPYIYSEVFAECMNKLLLKMVDKGIATTEDLYKECQKHINVKTWKSSLFSNKSIFSINELPGVYGFKNDKNEFVYIAKATNLKKRLLSYFQQGVDSTDFIIKLRKHAVDYTVHYCGSELECLLYEYRLIKKHNPILNINSQYFGSFKNVISLLDSIILLPHHDREKGMSFWIRENQELVMKSFYTDCRDDAMLLNQLKDFFILKKQSVKTSDIIEMQLVTKWVTQHNTSITHLPVYQMTSTKQILNIMRDNWRKSS